MKCPSCGFEDNGNFCSNCGNPLNSKDEKEEIKPVSNEWTYCCPVCRNSSLKYELQKKFLGLSSNDSFFCSECKARFVKSNDKYKLTSVSDKNHEIWNNYSNKALTEDEWNKIAHGGVSDEKQKEIDIKRYYSELSQGIVDLGSNPNSPVILKKNEEHVVSIIDITLKEPRAVRKTSGGYGGPRIRVAKGVSFNLGAFSASGESHDEIRDIDAGILTITSKRIIFSGSTKTTNIPLEKIISINPYIDGIGINRENKEKMQYFVGLPKIDNTIEVEGRTHNIPFSGLMLMSIIEGLINRINNPETINLNESNNNSDSNLPKSAEERKFNIQVERNLKGKDLEKNGETDEAIKLYELNIAEGFEGNHPYDRLAIIYRKKKQYSEEIRVLERAIFVFENYASSKRPDVSPKLEKFYDRLEKAKILKEKNE